MDVTRPYNARKSGSGIDSERVGDTSRVAMAVKIRVRCMGNNNELQL